MLELRDALWENHRIAPARQMIMGLKGRGKDEELLKDAYKAGSKLVLIGTPDVELEASLRLAAAACEDKDDDEADRDGGGGDEGASASSVPPEKRPENIERVNRRAFKMKDKIELRARPRPNSRLLVLDIDYTLMDHKSVAENFSELQRPYLHEFLEACYAHNYGALP